MWQQYIILALALASMLGCAVGLPAPEELQAPYQNIGIPEIDDKHVQRRAVSTCESST